ncbi:MAG: hypothetical protein ABIO06_06010 [Pseudolysinimonas sp.]
MNMVFPRVALAVLLVVGMSGCVSSLNGGQHSARPSASPAAQALGSAVDDRCKGLISPADYKELWAGSLKPIGYTSYGAGSDQTMAGTALVQSKALVCSWSDQGGAPAALMIAMGGGADGFHRTQATFAAPGSHYVAVPLVDGAYVACRGDASQQTCHWNVLSGSDWISLMIVGLTAGEVASPDLVTTGQGPLVSALAKAVSALHVPKTPSATPSVDCNKLLTPGALVEPLGVESSRITVAPSPALEKRSLDESSPEFGQMMWKYAYDLLGYSGCGILVDGHLVGAAVIAKDSAWVLHDSSAQQPKLQKIGGHGEGVEECTSEDSSSSCVVAFASGNDLLFAEFVVPKQMDGTAVALATLELLLV